MEELFCKLTKNINVDLVIQKNKIFRRHYDLIGTT